MTTPTLVGVETAAWANSASWSHTTTMTSADGDVLYVIHFSNGDHNDGDNFVTPTAPSGNWTQRLLSTEPGWEPGAKVWSRPMTTSGTFTVTLPAVGLGNHLGGVVLLRGAVEIPEDADESFGDNTTNHIVPAGTAATADALSLSFSGTRGGTPGVYTWPTSTERIDTAFGSGSNGGVFTVGTRVLSASGSTGVENLTGTAVTNWGEFISGRIIIAGAAAAAGAVKSPLVAVRAAVQRALY